MKSIAYLSLLLSITYLLLNINSHIAPILKNDTFINRIEIKDTIALSLLKVQALEKSIQPLKVAIDTCSHWGGELISIGSDGLVTLKTASSLPPLIKNFVSRHDRYRLLDLLVTQKAWQHEKQPPQKVDHCKYKVMIEYKGLKSEIWEWNAELADNQRIIKINQMILEITGKR